MFTCPWCQTNQHAQVYQAMRRPHWLPQAGWLYRCPHPNCRQFIALKVPIVELASNETSLVIPSEVLTTSLDLKLGDLTSLGRTD